jgi:hypothetical protein
MNFSKSELSIAISHQTRPPAGLGDFVPTTDFNKVICSIFIYFGVACIGLLLGSYIASMLDETSHQQARENRINACPNCARLQNIKDAAERRQLSALASLHARIAHPGHGRVGGHESRAMPLTRHSSARGLTFSHPGYSIDIDSKNDEGSTDDSFHSGHKKIKRQHHVENEEGLDCRLSSIQEKQTHQNFSHHQFSPLVSTDERPTRNDSTFTTRTQPGNTAPSYPGGMSDTGENVKTLVRTKVPPPPPPPMIGAASSMPGELGMPALMMSPISLGTPRQTNQSSPRDVDSLGSPMTKQILDRQSHTRHASFDVNGIPSANDGFGWSLNTPRYSFDTPKMFQPPTIGENVPFFSGTGISATSYGGVRFETEDSLNNDEEISTDDSSVLSSEIDSTDDPDNRDLSKDRVRAAKYIFLTLKEALVNSLVIIAVGCLGFWYIEGFSLVDSKFSICFRCQIMQFSKPL